MKTDIDAAVNAILAGPKGPRIGAFFDFDGTLIHGYSAAVYFIDRLRRGGIGARDLLDIARMAATGDPDPAGFADIIGKGIAEWAGRTEQELAELWARLFEKKIAMRLFPEAWQLVKAHQKMGHTVAIASSATSYQVAPAAAELGIDHLLCTQAMVRRGRLTGGIQGEPLWGTGKADAVRAFAKANRITLSRSHGYANGNEDIAFLQTVGHATAVNPKLPLRQAANRDGWKILRFAPRGRPSLTTLARSAAAWGAFAATVASGLAYVKAGGDKSRAGELVGSVGSDMMLTLAGVELEVIGERHLWEHRPAVFVFNHQSNADGYVVLSLTRRGVAGVAKKEAAAMPVVGTYLRLAQVVFIDRANSSNAIEAMRPLVQRLQQGTSILISPEGTRSRSPRLGRFKKGAFHLARQAGVPVVPIVIRNAGEVMARDSLLMRAGKVQVCVLPAIDVAAWNADELEHHVNEVRSLFQQTLDHWPAPEGKL